MLAVFDPSRSAHVEAPAELPTRGWLHVDEPSNAELERVRAAGFPTALLAHALDENELARVDHADGTTLVVLRVPFQPAADDQPFRTTSLAVLIKDELVVTVSRRASAVIAAVLRAQDADLDRSGRLLPRLLLAAGDQYLLQLGAIEAQVEGLEEQLQASQRNRELVGLLRCQKSLVHFTTALASNEIMLERLVRDVRVGLRPEDHDLMEDAVVELRQAAAMTKIQEDILGQMMDAFASIISNNLNVVMKVLTVMTIVLTIPTMVASFYGMNVALPAQHHPWAFAGTLAVSLVGALAAVLWFRHRRWL